MARPSLKANVSKPDAGKAAEVARKLTAPQAAAPDKDYEDFETVSYNLPIDLITLYRDLAEARLKVDREAKRSLRAEIRQAKRDGRTPPADPPLQARRSASAIVREAMESYRKTVEAELNELGG
jgi:hypothetical protein